MIPLYCKQCATLAWLCTASPRSRYSQITTLQFLLHDPQFRRTELGWAGGQWRGDCPQPWPLCAGLAKADIPHGMINKWWHGPSQSQPGAAKRLPFKSFGPGHPRPHNLSSHFSILAWRIPWAEEPGKLHTVHGVTKNRTWLRDLTLSHFSQKKYIIEFKNKFLSKKLLH